MPPLSLFDAPPIWLTDPVEAFAAFVLRPDFSKNRRGEPQGLRDSSVIVYRARWGKFVADCLLPFGRTLADVSVGDLEVFCSGMSPSSRHHYVRLLERVFDHLGELGIAQVNVARAMAISSPTRSNQGQDGTAVLSVAFQAAVLRSLPLPVNWKRARDRALICVILGAGLRVAEVIGLSVDQVGEMQEDGSVPVDISSVGASRRHRTRVQAFAASIVLGWKRERQGLLVDGQAVAGGLLFPADVSGRTLHPATVYRRVASVLASAGIPESLIKRRGARTLRNTYAVRELAAGSPIHLVGEALGHASDRATLHYLAIARRSR